MTLEKKKKGQPVRETTNIVQSGAKQSRGENPLIGGRKPPHKGENGRPDRPPRRRGGPGDGDSNGNRSSHGNGNGNGRPHRNGNPNGSGDPNGGGDPDGNGEPLRRGEEPPRRNGEQGRGGGGIRPQ